MADANKSKNGNSSWSNILHYVGIEARNSGVTKSSYENELCITLFCTSELLTLDWKMKISFRAANLMVKRLFLHVRVTNSKLKNKKNSLWVTNSKLKSKKV